MTATHATKAHFIHQFTSHDTGVTHHLVISDMKAPGFMGLYIEISEAPEWATHS